MSYIPNVHKSTHSHSVSATVVRLLSPTGQQNSVNRSNTKFQENPLRSSQPVTYTQLGMIQFLRAIPLSPHYCIPSSPNKSASIS